MKSPIYVTQPYLPPLEEFQTYLQQIWGNKTLTNNGPFHKQLEAALCDYLDVQYISLFSNGTLALQTALQSLKITGEVITTPYSFVATTHALWWNNIKPVFADIEPQTFNLDPAKIEAAISPQTTAILPVHVYGMPCKVEAIKKIADTYGLKVIYDAAHTFGGRINGQAICSFGDLSVLSFHATKVYNTFEGGAIVCHDEKTKKRIDYIKNFGFADEVTVVAPGINAKLNEVQAAFGLLQLKYVNDAICKRKEIFNYYNSLLNGLKGITLPEDMPGLDYNYPYYPILINTEEFGLTRNEVYNKLKEKNIFARRYFHPLISEFPTYKGLTSAAKQNLPVASKTANQILCLPIYPDLSIANIERICMNFI